MEHIFLAGLMGSGKSTLAKELSFHLGRPSYDLDIRVSEKYKTSIPNMIAEGGWEFFRKREHDELLSIAFEQEGIVALGGGTVLNPDSFPFMRSYGASIYLDVPLKSLVKRIGLDRQRPLLAEVKSEVDLIAKLQQLNEERFRYYSQCDLKLTIDDGELIEETTMRILDLVKKK